MPIIVGELQSIGIGRRKLKALETTQKPTDEQMRRKDKIVDGKAGADWCYFGQCN
jgi:hypothetical protein